MFFSLYLTSISQTQPAWDESWMEQQLRLTGQGSTQALERIYQKTRTAVYAYLLSILRNRSDAEDCLQETYIGIFKAASRYQPEGHAKSWIFAIAKNQAMMRFREQSRYAPDGEAILEEYPDQDPSERIRDRAALEAALQILGREECQIVILHAVSGFKHREIARLLSLPLNTVLSKYHRALKQLKRTLMEGEENA